MLGPNLFREEEPEAAPAERLRRRRGRSVSRRRTRCTRVDDALGVGWYQQHGTAADLAALTLCRLRRARAGERGGPEAGDEAVRAVLRRRPGGAPLDREPRDLVHGRERVPGSRRAVVRRRDGPRRLAIRGASLAAAGERSTRRTVSRHTAKRRTRRRRLPAAPGTAKPGFARRGAVPTRDPLASGLASRGEGQAGRRQRRRGRAPARGGSCACHGRRSGRGRAANEPWRRPSRYRLRRTQSRR